MNFEYKHLLDSNFHPNSRVWIYQCNRLFTLNEALEIEDLLKEFTTNWKSHEIPVKGDGHLFFGQFIVLLADESATGVSGCSTDSSVRLIKDIEQRYAVSMFDRTTLAFLINNKSDPSMSPEYRIQLLPLSQLQYAIENRFIHADTIYFNNLVQTKEELERNWMVAVKNSWLSSKINLIAKA